MRLPSRIWLKARIKPLRQRLGNAHVPLSIWALEKPLHRDRQAAKVVLKVLLPQLEFVSAELDRRVRALAFRRLGFAMRFRPIAVVPQRDRPRFGPRWDLAVCPFRLRHF